MKLLTRLTKLLLYGATCGVFLLQFDTQRWRKLSLFEGPLRRRTNLVSKLTEDSRGSSLILANYMKLTMIVAVDGAKKTRYCSCVRN